MNFAHGGLFMLGAYCGSFVYLRTGRFDLSLLAGALAGVGVGWLVERTLIRPVYGNPVGQILITIGAMMVLDEAIKAVFGPNILNSPVPAGLDGAWTIAGLVISRYRIFIIITGLLVALVIQTLLHRTRLGLMIRAGVENAEMVTALGVPVRLLFSLVFVVGTALAAVGGVLMGPLLGAVGPHLSVQYMMLGFVVVVIGGMGSFVGSMVAGLLVGLTNNYVAWVAPEVAMVVNVLLMAVILLAKPSGLFGMREEA
jgi:branched-chain amino acid transport system permease protein